MPPRSLMERFLRQPTHRRWMLVQAVWWLALARAAIVWVPFARIAGALGRVVPPSDGLVGACPADPPPTDVAVAREVGWAVTRAARYVPFEAVCLPQAIAAKMMLRSRRVPSALYFGVTKTDGQLQAHAWLSAAGVEVTGYPVAFDYTPLSCFV